MYLSRIDLLERVSSKELAELATPEHQPVVDVPLLERVLREQSTVDYTPVEVDNALVARTVIDRALGDTTALIDGYLQTRYTLPLSPVPAVLKRIATDCVRYYLMDQRATDEVRRRFDAQVRLLAAMQRGDFSLGADEPAGATALPAIEAPSRVMTRDRLGAY